ncbi:MAG: CoA-transferase [Actinomycetota bacterium]|nr:CoA-transferase [Actinomycetota bacterium]
MARAGGSPVDTSGGGHEAAFVSLEALAGEVRDGDCVGVGGALLTRLPLAAVHAVAARGPRHLTYASWGGGLPLEILIGAGAVDKLVFCFSSLDVFGLAPLFRRALEAGEIEVEEWPAFGFAARLEAAKQNLPYMPFRIPAAGGIPAAGSFGAGSAPGVGHAPRLDLDVLLLHAQRADGDGNVEIHGARGMDTTAAFAARRVLVTVEEVVDGPTLGTLRDSFVLTREFVHSVAVVPYGAYPSSCIPYYTADFRRLAEVTAASPPPDSEPPSARRSVELGRAATLSGARVREGVRRAGVARRSAGDVALDAADVMVWRIARLVEDGDVCSAGAVSPLAVTAYLLAKATHAPRAQLLMTSGGLLDVGSRPMLLGLGEALDTASAAAHCGGEDSYRWYYQQGRVALEVVTAAQVDRHARANNVSVTSPSGRTVRLPGQGGMADVADLHQNFVLYLARQSPLSLVDSVERVSAVRGVHGRSAREALGLRGGFVRLVTNLAEFVLDPDADELVLESIHPGVALADVEAACGFEPTVSEALHETEVPPPDVLEILDRDVDPLGIRRLELVPARERSEALAACIAAEEDVVRSACRLGGSEGARARSGTCRGSPT